MRIAQRRSFQDYDLHPDGERFVVMMSPQEQVEEKRDKVVLIQNFFELLRQEVGSQEEEAPPSVAVPVSC